jgi:hypothetical protein
MTSSQQSLLNLLKIGKLKAEPPGQNELNGLVTAAERRLRDAENPALSPDSRFSLGYDAAHSLALAALRWHGYRTENRYMVFQALQHTLSFSAPKWRFLDNCHQKRNIVLYDGDLIEDEPLIKELIVMTKELLLAVKALGPINRSE